MRRHESWDIGPQAKSDVAKVASKTSLRSVFSSWDENLTIEKLKVRRKKAVKTAVRVEICNGGKDENWEISLARPGSLDDNCQIWSNSKRLKEKQVTNAQAHD